MKNKFYQEVIRLQEIAIQCGGKGYMIPLLVVSYYHVFEVPGFIYSIGQSIETGKIVAVSPQNVLDEAYKKKDEGENLRNFEKPILDQKDLFYKNPKFLSEVIGRIEVAFGIIYLWKNSFVVLNPSGNFRSLLICTSKESEVSELTEMIKSYSPDSKNGRVTYKYLVNSKAGLVEKSLGFDKFYTDLKKYYNSDLPWERLEKFIKEDTEGLVLLYGNPGGGKTSLIKYLISENSDKNFVLASGSELKNLNTSELMDYILWNRGSIFIIEDCESLLATRTRGTDLSALLNLTDGILGQSLKIRFICTFNTNLGNIDPALLRKGRLKLKYEFSKLSLEKTRDLIKDATSSMYLADIFGKEENDYSKKTIKIGF